MQHATLWWVNSQGLIIHLGSRGNRNKRDVYGLVLFHKNDKRTLKVPAYYFHL